MRRILSKDSACEDLTSEQVASPDSERTEEDVLAARREERMKRWTSGKLTLTAEFCNLTTDE